MFAAGVDEGTPFRIRHSPHAMRLHCTQLQLDAMTMRASGKHGMGRRRSVAPDPDFRRNATVHMG